MKDSEILDLYFARSENAISETDSKYGTFCRGLTCSILGNREDSEECVSDIYLKLWNVIPPERPEKFRAFIARVARNTALNMLEKLSAAKRGGKNTALAYEELAESIPDPGSVDKQIEDAELSALIDRFLRSLSGEKQMIFMKRYWYFCSVSEIAEQMHISEGKVKMSLHRTREKLREFLEKEGVQI